MRRANGGWENRVSRFLAPVERLLGVRNGTGPSKNALSDQLASQLSDLDMTQRLLDTDWFRDRAEPQLSSGPDGRRLLVFAPHPDDEIIGCGGVLLNAVKIGCEIQVVYVTDGISPKLHGTERLQRISRRYAEAKKVWRSR